MKNSSFRMMIISGLTIVLALVCVVRLFDLQIVKGSSYEEQANQRLVRAYSIPAPRGEIVDKNGKPLVENRMGYTVQIQKMDMTDEELNSIIYKAAYLVGSYGAEIESIFPIVINPNTDKLDFDFNIEKNGGTRKVLGAKLNDYTVAKMKKLKEESEEATEETTEKTKEEIEEEKKQAEQNLSDWKKKNKLTDYTSAEEIFSFYKSKYDISGEYNENEALVISAVRYAMEKNGFSEKNPYILARDIDEYAVQPLKERFMDFPGVEVVIEPIRIFSHGTMASHILGRTGKIYAEEYAEMKDKGYGMNDTIGKDGLEKVLESYLKGKDGYKSVEMSRGGGVTQILQSREPEPGNYAKLTLDVDLQAVAESALKEGIMEAYGSGGAGAVIAVDPKTGGVLAMASYPTYDLSTFNDNYDKLLKSKSKPLINRVLNGTYSPGSTFKPMTAIAALESGEITPNTYIADLGKYTYYPSYQPTCLVYSSTGATHGTINVSEAIGVSCNYFFYDIGRRMGVDTLRDYAEKFGLGEPTGIELQESTGILAGPEEREKAGGVWYPGDVLQMAIGQSDNLFTPAQLASYVCTILNKGKRYSLHLVDEVVNYDTGEVVMKKEPEVLSDNTISDETYNAVINGMRQVVTVGTASAAFATSTYKAAGKTGTAEVPGGADNVLFVGFAPYEDPEIVVAVIIEHGAKSGYAAGVARKIFDAYMQIKDGKFKTSLSENGDDGDEKSLPPAEVNSSETKENSTDSKKQQESNKQNNSSNDQRDAVMPKKNSEDIDGNDPSGEGTL